MLRMLKWAGAVLVVIVLGLGALMVIDRWNGLRDPISRAALKLTGRTLDIRGPFDLDFGWRSVRFSLADTTFSNPGWARDDHMIAVGAASFELLLAPLLRGEIVLDQVRLSRASVNFEQGTDGRKNWLLDREQRDEATRVDVRRFAIRQGQIVYFDPMQKTDLRVAVSSNRDAVLPLDFKAHGRYRGQRLVATGKGGNVLSLRETGQPYEFAIEGRIGPTAVEAAGEVTDFARPSSVKLKLMLSGASLAQLYPLIGVVLPDTPRYTTAGTLGYENGVWRYARFKSRIGESDLAGDLQVDTRADRPLLTATLRSRRLDLADLGPLVGTRPPAPLQRASQRVLPNAPFRTERWNRMNARVTLTADALQRPAALPLENLSTRLSLQDAVLTLDPLRFGIADGELAGRLRLDGKASPIRAEAHLKLRRIKLNKLFPLAETTQAGIGEFNGRIDLVGQGNHVAAMLATADGRVGLIIGKGEISKFMMEAAGLHVLEMLQIKLAGDKNIQLNCGIADFTVARGVMKSDTLVVDTDITRIEGTGVIALADETLDITILPKSKKFSLVALRTPIHVAGRFAQPEVSLNKGQLALRGLGAVALGAVNPALSLLLLADTGSETASGCRALIDARTRPAL